MLFQCTVKLNGRVLDAGTLNIQHHRFPFTIVTVSISIRNEICLNWKCSYLIDGLKFIIFIRFAFHPDTWHKYWMPNSFNYLTITLRIGPLNESDRYPRKYILKNASWQYAKGKMLVSTLPFRNKCVAALVTMYQKKNLQNGTCSFHLVEQLMIWICSCERRCHRKDYFFTFIFIHSNMKCVENQPFNLCCLLLPFIYFLSVYRANVCLCVSFVLRVSFQYLFSFLPE